MASRRKRSENETEQPVASPLHAEILRALRRLVSIEGSIAAVARGLGIVSPSLDLSRQELSRWLARGIPKGALEGDRQAALLFALGARLRHYDIDQPTRDARDRRIAESAAATEILRTFRQKRERKRLVDLLRGWCRRHDEVARLLGLRRSGVQQFAAELGVRAELVRQALRPGEESLSVKLFLAFRRFEERQREQAEEDEIDRAKMIELMTLAAVPAQTKRQVQRTRRRRQGGRWVYQKVWVTEEFEEPVLPKISGGSWEFSGEGTHGRRWGYPVGKFLTPRLHPSGNDAWKTIEGFVRFALAVPGLSPPSRYPEWNVYGLASELGDSEVGSKKQYRELGHPDARRFVVSEAYSGGNRRPPRARERSVSSRKTEHSRQGFLQHIAEGLATMNLIYLHGGVAWNFRRRTEDERRRIEKARRETYELEKTLEVVRARVAEASRKKKAKRLKRKKILAGVLARRQERKKQ